jgi:hypothetical protein
VSASTMGERVSWRVRLVDGAEALLGTHEMVEGNKRFHR